MKKKVLLMGASGSGKTSMRSLIFSNNPASLTSRLGATIDVEQNHVRFLGDLILNLWDCGGQDAFMDSYLSTQQSTIFSHVGVLIYVFEVESRNMLKDLEYYTDCLRALRRYSPEANVFLLVHKMDLVRAPQKRTVLDKKARELRQVSGDMAVTVFGTSIYDESLYKAWSKIVHTLIPNVSVLTKHLTTLADACSATEVIMFERTTFLVIATSSPPPSTTTPPRPISPPRVPSPQFEDNSTPPNVTALSGSTTPFLSTSRTTSPPPPTQPLSSPLSNHSTSSLTPNSNNTPYHDDTAAAEDAPSDPHSLDPTRYERTSELIKAFKHSCARVRDEFHTLEMELADFTAVLDELTKNTYVLVVVHNPTIETAALRMNIRLARGKFEDIQGENLLS
ncbi:Gtr1/RagA G protein conserved region-domain-containing protein [Cristinia sonorae]|uniref:GTP-binding protein n=1 Tax=Cristinia sonorae TaxID=1940300 RepID=A0A8K0UNS2_9AGAR|nr:Gtr1/RagA G protein conserved region-domain-containing protein [Cristinia sonorae]